jgi:hypothetical protein
MALLRLRDTETRARHLPEICMACGEPSVDHIKKTFSWYPPWIGWLFLVGGVPLVVILVLVLTKRMSVELPVCERHRGYFWKRTLWICVALLVPFLAWAAVFAIAMALVDRRDEDSVFGFTCLAFVVVLLLVIGIIAVVQNYAIRPKEITDRTISLIRVHEGFVEAWEAHRDRGWDAIDDEPRGRRRDRGEDQHDDRDWRGRDVPPERRESFRERRDEDDDPRPRKREP